MHAARTAVRGRVFGLFITVGGLLGNLSHWIVGAAVGLGYGAASYYPSYSYDSGYYPSAYSSGCTCGY